MIDTTKATSKFRARTVQLNSFYAGSFVCTLTVFRRFCAHLLRLAVSFLFKKHNYDDRRYTRLNP